MLARRIEQDLLLCSSPLARRSNIAASSDRPRMAKAPTEVRNESAAGETVNRVGAERRIGNQRDGAHRREMMGNDCDRQQASGSQGISRIVATHGDEHRKRREHASEHDRGQNDTGRPHNKRRKLECRHAGIVHRCDADADDAAAEGNHQSAARSTAQCRGRWQQCYRKDQRQHGDGNAVSGAGAGIVSQHRDEMGSPDSAAADRRIEADPDRARSALRGPGTMKQADGDSAGEPANGACQHNQTPVMLGDEAIKNAVHYRPLNSP